MRWSSAVVRAVLVLPVVAFRVPEIPTNFGVDQHIVQHMDSARVLPATSRHSSIRNPAWQRASKVTSIPGAGVGGTKTTTPSRPRVRRTR